MADFRGDAMPSPEGEGRAKATAEQAWDAYYKMNKAINKPLLDAVPQARNVLRGWAGGTLVDLVGFWVMWHLCGGFDGVKKATGLSRTSIYRRISLFRQVFGEHPDVFVFSGIEIDPVEFVQGMAARKN